LHAAFFFCDDQPGQFRCLLHVGEAAFDDLSGFLLDALEVEFDEFAGDGADFGEGLPSGLFFFERSIIYGDTTMEGFKLERPGRGIGGDANELPRGEAADHRSSFPFSHYKAPADFENTQCSPQANPPLLSS
jgi:hypothetical protein